LLNTVVQKFVGALLLEDEPGADGLPEDRVYRLLRFPVNHAQGGDLGDIAQAGEIFQSFLCPDILPFVCL
jgi:hypothetical protein